MNHKTNALIGTFLLGLMVSASSPHARAADPETPSVRAALQAKIDTVNAMLKRKAPGKEVAEVLYEEDLMIIGEGEKSLYRDLQSFQKPLADYVAQESTCTISIIDPIRHSGNLAAAFLLEHCPAAKAGEKDDDARMMYVFRKGAKGWRVTMEMFGWGAF
jgi:ketosteroid isomerase-like protein